jgi:hypothetical protein
MMGCDIHQMTFLYNKKYKKYVNCGDILGYEIERVFPQLVPDRCYNIFGMIAGVRNNRHMLHLNDGFPKCLNKIFKEQVFKIDLHTPVWITPIKFNKKLQDLKKKLIKNKKVYQKLSKKYNGDELYDKLYEIYEDNYDGYWGEDDDCYINYIDELCQKLEYYTNSVDEWIKELFDIKKTIIFFYFDC